MATSPSPFPFDGLDLEPTPAQAEMIRSFRDLVEQYEIDEPDIIQPRPGNPGVIEVFWVRKRVCIVIESEAQIESMFELAEEQDAA